MGLTRGGVLWKNRLYIDCTPFENKVLTQIAVTYDCSEVAGVEYQQNMEKARFVFGHCCRKRMLFI